MFLPGYSAACPCIWRAREFMIPKLQAPKSKPHSVSSRQADNTSSNLTMCRLSYKSLACAGGGFPVLPEEYWWLPVPKGRRVFVWITEKCVGGKSLNWAMIYSRNGWLQKEHPTSIPQGTALDAVMLSDQSYLILDVLQYNGVQVTGCTNSCRLVI